MTQKHNEITLRDKEILIPCTFIHSTIIHELVKPGTVLTTRIIQRDIKSFVSDLVIHLKDKVNIKLTFK